jgi:predicted metal-dependent hydrolase
MLRINGHVIKYTVRRVGESSYVHMRFRPNLQLEVSIPSNRQIEVEKLLQKKRKWIERTYDEITTTRRIFTGKHVLFRGTPYRIMFTRKGNRVRIGNGKLLLPLREGEGEMDALKRWMSRQTSNLIRRRLSEYQRKYDFSFTEFFVEKTRRWGYCTKEKRLVFNWELAALPPSLFDYVLLHEIAHLSETGFNHSRRFKHSLSQMCPDFREKNHELKRYSSQSYHVIG